MIQKFAKRYKYKMLIKTEKKIFQIICIFIVFSPLFISIYEFWKIFNIIKFEFFVERTLKLYLILFNLIFAVILFIISIYYYSRFFWLILFITIVPWSYLVFSWLNS